MAMYLAEPETSLPLVPPARLAALLVARRQQENVDRETIALRSYGLFDTGDIELLESGRAPLSDETIRAVTQLYDLGAGPVIPGRSRLIVDLDMGTIEADGQVNHLPRAEAPLVLERYLALVYVMRGIEPGTEIQLRRNDLEVLAEALAIADEEVSSRLHSLMTSPIISRRTRRLSRKLSIPGVGLLVGFTTMGALILAPAAAAEEVVPEEASAQVSESIDIAPSVNELQLSMPQSEYQSPELERIQAGQVSLVENADEVAIVDADEVTTAADSSPADQTTAEADPEIVVAVDEAVATQKIDAADGLDVDQPTNQDTSATAPAQTQPATVDQASSVEQQKPAEQVVPVATASPSPAQIGAQAETLISYNYQQKLPGWTIVYEGDRSGYRGMTNRIHKTVTIYVRDGDTPSQVAEILAHELGHALDLELLSNDQRLEWLAARGMPQVWWVDNGHTDFEAGQGDFAEAVAAIWVGSPSDSHHGSFTPEQLALAASFIQ